MVRGIKTITGKTLTRCCLFCLSFIFIADTSHAVNLFEAEAFSTTGNIRLRSSSSRFRELAERVIELNGEFRLLRGLGYQANMSYFGVPNAFTINVDPTGTRMVITSGLTSFTQVLEGQNRTELFQKFEQWLESGGIDHLETLLREVNKLSPVALADGNPQSATARTADGAYYSFAWEDPIQHRLSFEPRLRYGRFSAEAPAGNVGGSEWLIDLPLYAPILQHSGFVMNLQGEHTIIEGTRIYGGGANLGFAMKLVPQTTERPVSWTCTPYAGIYIRGSFDSSSGVFLANGGVTNRIEWRAREDLSVYYAGAFTYASSVSMDLFGTEFETGLRQFILKNGLGVRYETDDLSLAGGVILTNFLNNVSVDQYWTGDLQLNWRVDDDLSFGIEAQADIARDYMGVKGGPRLRLSF